MGLVCGQPIVVDCLQSATLFTRVQRDRTPLASHAHHRHAQQVLRRCWRTQRDTHSRIPKHAASPRSDSRLPTAFCVGSMSCYLCEAVYPHPTDSTACREQLLALARVASGCTRLVDSIFASDEEHLRLTTHKKLLPKAPPSAKPRTPTKQTPKAKKAKKRYDIKKIPPKIQR